MMQPYYSQYGYAIPVGMPAQGSPSQQIGAPARPEDIEVNMDDKRRALAAQQPDNPYLKESPAKKDDKKKKNNK